jgi:hypothetical protein
MTEPEFLEEYRGQSLDKLLSMEATHRIDSLVLAMEAALDQKLAKRGTASLSLEERIVLAIEALEREVNNGGYDQFFLNSSRTYAGEVEQALRAIGCPEQAEIAGRAVAALRAKGKIKGELTPETVETGLAAGGDALSELLNSLDDEYYACDEPIAERLFAFVKANKATIHLR